MTAKTKIGDDTRELFLGTSLTIDGIKEIQNKFHELIEENKNIILKSESIEIIDLAGIQFLIYAKKIAAKQKIKLTFDFTPSEQVLDLAVKTGFSKIFEI